MPQDTPAAALASAPRCVFVYGTLRRGGSNDITHLHPAPRLVGAAQVAGVLYHLGAYPGMTLGGTQWVQGEVYAITSALERVLDGIEDLVGPHPSDEYTKREVSVRVAGQAQALSCLVYAVNPRCVLSAPQIVHGDWLGAG